LDQDLILLKKLRAVMALSRREKRKEGEEASLPCGFWRVMEHLSETEEKTQQALAKELEIRPQSLSEALAVLEQRGDLSRRLDENDRRTRWIRLTAEGAAKRETLLACRIRRANVLFAPLSPEEKETLNALLGQIIEGNREE